MIALVTPLPANGGPVPGTILEHQAHAIGHATVLLADRGALLAGDTLSDVLNRSSTLSGPTSRTWSWPDTRTDDVQHSVLSATAVPT